MTPADLDAIEKRARAATDDIDRSDDDPPECRGCHDTFTLTDWDYEVTPFCDNCAHRHSEALGNDVLALIALARRMVAAEARLAEYLAKEPTP